MGRVIGFSRDEREGDHLAETDVAPGTGANEGAQHAAPPGVDARPLDSDMVVSVDVGGSLAAVAYADPGTPGESEAGEIQIYARDESGERVARVWLRADGMVEVTNDSGSLSMDPGGDVTINGVVIDASGNISAPGNVDVSGNVTASEVTAGSVVLTEHVHSGGAGGGLTGPPE